MSNTIYTVLSEGHSIIYGQSCAISDVNLSDESQITLRANPCGSCPVVIGLCFCLSLRCALTVFRTLYLTKMDFSAQHVSCLFIFSSSTEPISI
ncbi:hypothetical protein MHBO_005017 [Bonamia ostreae]|uniref:Uncharacterized protein n=1 Tax=Bonamia ostreae TaxID=126728 RepID=A0ABV2AUV8_9EUKA